MLRTAAKNASPMSIQKSPAVRSQRTKTWRTVGELESAKYGKSGGARKRLRPAGDIRKVVNGHCTATRMAVNATPPKIACCHLGASWKTGQIRSRKNAGTIRR